MGNPNILVIGNGFDLHHGLKTNYIDFVRFCEELSKSVKGTKGRDWVISNSIIKCFIRVATENQSWIDCEKEIEIIVTIFLKILSDRSVFDADPNYIDKRFTSLEAYEFERIKLMNEFCDNINSNTIMFHKRFFKTYQRINTELIIETLKRDLNNLIKLFKYYLEEKVINQSVTKLSNQIENIKPDYVINFNYTNTYEHYGINRQDVCYIHG